MVAVGRYSIFVSPVVWSTGGCYCNVVAVGRYSIFVSPVIW